MRWPTSIQFFMHENSLFHENANCENFLLRFLLLLSYIIKLIHHVGICWECQKLHRFEATRLKRERAKDRTKFIIIIPMKMTFYSHDSFLVFNSSCVRVWQEASSRCFLENLCDSRLFFSSFSIQLLVHRVKAWILVRAIIYHDEICTPCEKRYRREFSMTGNIFGVTVMKEWMWEISKNKFYSFLQKKIISVNCVK
jgi:hypothetical protein